MRPIPTETRTGVAPDEGTGSEGDFKMLTKTDAVYHETPPQQDNPWTPPTHWPQLGPRQRSVPERAFLAADLHRNRVELISPTVKQCAHLVGVCVPYVAAAVAIADNQAARTAVLAGDCTLLDAAKAVAPESLAEHFARSTPDEQRECARAIGPAIIWDRMIAPLV